MKVKFQIGQKTNDVEPVEEPQSRSGKTTVKRQKEPKTKGRGVTHNYAVLKDNGNDRSGWAQREYTSDSPDVHKRRY